MSFARSRKPHRSSWWWCAPTPTTPAPGWRMPPRSLTALEQEYSAAAIAPVAGNPKQASDLLAFAATSASEAEKALAGGQAGRAAVAVRAAQAAVGQVTQLLDAIDRAATDLGAARAALGAVVSDTEQDLAASRALPEGDPRLASAIAAAEAALTAAAAGGSPVASLTSLQKANAQLDAVLASVREEQEKVRRASAALDQAIVNARAEISAAHDFITTRRGAIGDTARTRLSEAMRRLDGAVAVATSDPVTALSQARAAANLAQNALAGAQEDVQQYSIPGLGGMGGGYGRGSIGADIGGAILGGIIGGMLSGGRGGGMFGGGGGGGGGHLRRWRRRILRRGVWRRIAWRFRRQAQQRRPVLGGGRNVADPVDARAHRFHHSGGGASQAIKGCAGQDAI